VDAVHGIAGSLGFFFYPHAREHKRNFRLLVIQLFLEPQRFFQVKVKIPVRLR
jgi:hypothetical protein